jgi:hypothetical protein
MRHAVLAATALALLTGCGASTTTVLTRPGPTVTATATATRTRTAVRPGPRVTVTAPGSGLTVTCFAYGGRAWLSQPGAGVPAVNGCRLTWTDVLPMSSGEVTFTLTAPDGSSSSWVSPSG